MPGRAERSPEGKKFGEELRRLRKERVPPLPVILKLADALKVNASSLLTPFGNGGSAIRQPEELT
jgi:hypothetical protein